jgi:DNA-directed RNA polymerase subunit B"
MNREKRRDISRQYFSRDRLAEHHFRSFNAFLNRGMQEVADEKETIDTDIGDKEGQEPVWVELGNVRITTPRVREADGSEELLYPQEARLRNITYSAPVFMEMTIMRGGEEEEPHIVDQSETKVGRIPIMIGSDACNIVDFDDDELIARRPGWLLHRQRLRARPDDERGPRAEQDPRGVRQQVRRRDTGRQDVQPAPWLPGARAL